MNHEQAHGQIIELTKESFTAQALEAGTPMLIDFWAPWCGPCRTMKPILSEIAQTLDGRVRVAQINVDEERELAAAFGIRSIPTCVLLQNGRVAATYVGVQSARQIVADVLDKLKVRAVG